MAQNPNLKRLVRSIGNALIRFVEQQGWKDPDYWIFYRTRPTWGRADFLLVAVGLNDQDESEFTRRAWEFLRNEFHDEPEVVQSMNLVVRSKKKVDEGGLYSIGSRYREFLKNLPTKTN